MVGSYNRLHEQQNQGYLEMARNIGLMVFRVLVRHLDDVSSKGTAHLSEMEI